MKRWFWNEKLPSILEGVFDGVIENTCGYFREENRGQKEKDEMESRWQKEKNESKPTKYDIAGGRAAALSVVALQIGFQ